MTYDLPIIGSGAAKAYWPPAIKEWGIADEFVGTTIVARYERDADVVGLFERHADGAETKISPAGTCWFAWTAAYPGTDLYR